MSPERLSDFKVLTFDCYGTLIDWETGILNELRPWATRHGLTLDDDTLLVAFAEEEATCERKTPEKLYPQILESVIERLAERWSVPLAVESVTVRPQRIVNRPATRRKISLQSSKRGLASGISLKIGAVP